MFIMTEQEFEEGVDMLRSKDSMIYEEGYHWILSDVDTFCENIMALMCSEADPQMRSKFIELLGDCSSKKVIPVLEAELLSAHRDVRFWAHSQLEYSEDSEANEIAKKYKENNPNEDWY